MPSVFRPIQLLQLVVVFAVHCGKLTDLLAEFKGERNKGREGVKHGWSHNGEGMGDEKEGDPSHRSNFSAVVAPMSRASVHRYAVEQLFLLNFSSSESILVVYSVTAFKYKDADNYSFRFYHIYVPHTACQAQKTTRHFTEMP